MQLARVLNYYKSENTLSCEIEDFVETHLCKLCVILRWRVLRVDNVCPHYYYNSSNTLHSFSFSHPIYCDARTTLALPVV